jgi:hypothetical protein
LRDVSARAGPLSPSSTASCSTSCRRTSHASGTSASSPTARRRPAWPNAGARSTPHPRHTHDGGATVRPHRRRSVQVPALSHGYDGHLRTRAHRAGAPGRGLDACLRGFLVIARAAASPGPITPSLARACLRAHDHPVSPGAPLPTVTLSVRSTVPGLRRDPHASWVRGVQNP